MVDDRGGVDLAGAIAACGDDLAIVDCLTVWVGNRFHHGRDERSIVTCSGDAPAVVVARAAPTIVVSNEVGLGIVPDNSSARSYRDALGQVNQAWVAAADRAGLLVAGRVVPLPDPTANADWFDG